MGNVFLFVLMWAMTLILLLAVYKLCFSGTTLHRFNRCYLLGATVLSAIIPLTHLSVPQTAVVPIHETYFAQTLQEVTVYGNAASAAEALQTTSGFSWAWLLVGCWAVYVIVLITGWTRSIIKTRRFLKGKTMHRLGHIRVVSHDEQFGPFSWMNYIVISRAESGFARRASIRHEISHIRLGHYADLVFLLACTIVNPVCWLIMKEIKIVHEYEADDEVINRYGIVEKDYQRLLIMRTVGAEAYALASSFNLNIKQRIIMMKKEKTMKRRMLYLLAVIPVIGLMSLLCANNANAAGLQSETGLDDTDSENVIQILKTEEQKPVEEKIANDEPLMRVENMPGFPGGDLAMMQYLSGNIKYPEEARDNNIQGRVMIQFVVEKDGSISDVKVIKSVHELLDSEALRCVSAMPAWTPGTQEGKPVRVSYTIPINFKFRGSDSDFKSVRVSYMKEMNVALFKSCKTPANAAMTVTLENLDNAIDDVINGRREFFEMDYSNYSIIQDALGNHGIDRIKYSADK